MSTPRTVALKALPGVLALAACSTSPEPDAARAGAEAQLDAEISARQGASVSRVCPGNGEGWEALRDGVLLLEADGEWYMVEVSGACDPGAPSAVIATPGRPGSSCLRRGDAIFTGRPRSGGRCVIGALYEWDENAAVEPSASARSANE